MAEGFKHGAGGNPLNFKVVGGTTEPSNPKENTIWVNTDTEITGWHFASKQPENMEDGTVWIYTYTASSVEFNALKKNGLQVRPLSAKQYVSGVWVDVTAKIYQNGEWVEWWDGTLLDGENTYDAFTGGWFRDTGMKYGSSPNSGQATFGSSGVRLVAVGLQSAIVRAKNPFDITSYKKLIVTVSELTAVGGKSVRVYVTKSSSGDPDGFTGAKIESISSNGDKELDVSSLTGDYYVVLGVANDRAATVNKVKLQ